MAASSRKLLTGYVIQNLIAVIVFGGLLLTNLMALSLYVFPGDFALWRVSGWLYKVFGQALDWTIFGGGRGPLLSTAILAAFVCLPVVSFMKRSWLGTAVAGHLALGICILLTSNAIGRATQTIHSASLAPYVAGGLGDPNTMAFVGLSGATLFLCVINHIVFFRQA